MKNGNKLLGVILIISFISLTTFPACRFNHGDRNLKVLKEKNFTINQGKQLKLNASSGDVQITTWDKQEVYVKILGNDRARKKVEFTFNQTDDYVEVIAENDDNFSFFGNNIQLKFEITLPKNFNSIVRTSGGDISISDLNGEQSIKTSGGNINADSISGNLNVTTSGGDIYISNSNCVNNLKTSGGNINAKECIGDLFCSTSGGDISLLIKDSKIEAHTSGGNIRINYKGQNKGMDLGTSGGDITIKVPEDFSASVNLKTSGGEIIANLKTSNIKEVSDNKLIADINNGGNLVTAITSGGNIKIK